MKSTTPVTKYARSGNVHIAYQVVGDGPLDVVFVPGFVSHVELSWDVPPLARFLRRLASFSRLILFDKRGTGLSDHVPSNELPTLEERMDDVRAVMDAAHSERAALLGLSEGGPMNVLFAATYPQRTQALVLIASFARMTVAPDYPIGTPPEAFEAFVRHIAEGWGTGVAFHTLMPSAAGDEATRDLWAKYQRMSASPGTVEALLRMTSATDARGVLSAISAPTLVLHRGGDRWVGVAHGRYLGAHIPGARYVELPGDDHLAWQGDGDTVVDEIAEFLTGVREAAEPERVLATVLFVDIVGSTAQAAALGDVQWRDRLERYYAALRRELARFRGREIDTAGDGLFASFDGPARAIRCARAIVDDVRAVGLEVRAGIHTGECEIIGDKIGGIAVHLGARIAAEANAGEVLVSGTVKDLVAGSGIAFDDRGARSLRGIPGEWRLYLVRPGA